MKFALPWFLILASQILSALPSSKELKIGTTQEFETLNPVIAQMSATRYINAMTNRALAQLDPDGKWYPQLAQTIPSFENKLAQFNPDKTKIIATWNLKPKATWGDGTPVTCADLEFTRQVATAPTVTVGEKEIYESVEKIEWKSETPKKCIFTYRKATYDYYQLATFFVLPAHIEKAVFEQYKAQNQGYEKNTLFVKNPSLPGLSNGPYQVSEVKLGSHVVLIPNPHFYGKTPQIQKIVVKLIPNSTTLEANLRSGNIDKISPMGLSFDQALAFEKKIKLENLPYKIVFRTGCTYEHIDFNLDNPILKDKKVRQALTYGLNRQELVQALFENKQKVAVHNISPMDKFWFIADPKIITLYPFNRAKAESLLDEAGWKLNGSGVRAKDGQKLSLALMTTAGNKQRETVQTFIQDQWKKLGIEVVIRNEPARVMFSESMKKRTYPALAMYAWVSAPDILPRSNLYSKNIPSEKNGYSGQNFPGWNNSEVDRLLDLTREEQDPKKRQKNVHDLLKIYTDELPVLPLFYRADIAVIPENLKNFRLTGHQFYETYFVENWEL